MLCAASLQVSGQRTLVEQPGSHIVRYSIQHAAIVPPIGAVGVVLATRMVVEYAVFHNTDFTINMALAWSGRQNEAIFANMQAGLAGGQVV